MVGLGVSAGGSRAGYGGGRLLGVGFAEGLVTCFKLLLRVPEVKDLWSP